MHSVIQKNACRTSIVGGRTMTLSIEKGKQEHIARALKVSEKITLRNACG